MLLQHWLKWSINQKRSSHHTRLFDAYRNQSDHGQSSTHLNQGDGSICSRNLPFQWKHALLPAAGKPRAESGSFLKMISKGKGLRLRNILRQFQSWTVTSQIKALCLIVCCAQHCSSLNAKGTELLGWNEGQHYNKSLFLSFFDIVASCTFFFDWWLLSPQDSMLFGLLSQRDLHMNVGLSHAVVTLCGPIPCQWCGVNSMLCSPPWLICPSICNSRPWKLCQGKGSSWDSRGLT